MNKNITKILWVTNKLIPAVENEINGDAKLVNEGWISAMFNQLSEEKSIELVIACFGTKENGSGEARHFRWYTVAESWKEEKVYSDKQKETMKSIINQEIPDIIHIWGTEYPHTLAVIDAADELGMIDNVIVSIQGLISECAKYYCAGLPDNVIKSNTLLDYIRKTNIYHQQAMFAQRGEYEIKAFKKIRHVIGRTIWDNRCVLSINPELTYHFCNETLRKEFYDDRWSLHNCVKHRIFVSQASYPLKGFHVLLDILPQLKEVYPDIQIHVCGVNPVPSGSLKSKIMQTSYGKYLADRIKKIDAGQVITFLGKLNAEEIRSEYMSANVFLLCSSIENSSNSVGEAMLLGMPIVASDVGGIPTILHAPSEGLMYTWDDRQALFKCICSYFDNDDLAISTGENARKHAFETHNSEKNYETIIKIYEEMLSE